MTDQQSSQFMSFEAWIEKSGLDEDPDVVKIDYLAAKAEWELHQFEQRHRKAGRPAEMPFALPESNSPEAEPPSATPAASSSPSALPQRRWWWPF